MKRIFNIVVLLLIFSSCSGQFFWSHTKKDYTDKIKYGLLYNWYAVSYSNGGASIAPEGWHVPTSTEYQTLLTYLGGNSVSGSKLRETGEDYWTDNIYSTNESGLSLVGSGFRTCTGFFGIKYSASLVCSNSDEFNYISDCSEENVHPNYFIITSVDAEDIFIGEQRKSDGYSVRLIKDDSTNPGTLTDYDGNVYPTVKIGDQVWMAANLAVVHYNDGTPIPEVTDNSAWAALTTGALCAYNNDWSNVFK